MDTLLLKYIGEVLKQLNKKLVRIIVAASVISFAILCAGMMYNPKYSTSITIFADHQNVIKPLLEGKGGAAVTAPKNERIRVVQKVMFSPNILEQVVNCCIDSRIASGSENW